VKGVHALRHKERRLMMRLRFSYAVKAKLRILKKPMEMENPEFDWLACRKAYRYYIK
jgi:hypothetical protein